MRTWRGLARARTLPAEGWAMRVFYLVILSVALAWAEPAWIELPEPSPAQLEELHRAIGVENSPEHTANSVKALFYRPELAPLVVGLDRASRAKLPARLYWLLAVEVSRANGCDYCLSSAQSALAAGGGGPPDAREQTALDYARKLTLYPGDTRPEDLRKLESAGFRQDEIFEVALTVSWYNFMNRMARGLGYGPDHFHRF